MEEAESVVKSVDHERRDADICIAAGAGVGALGAAAAALTGAVCPLCIFVAPGLAGYGAYKRWKISRAIQRGENDD